VSVVCIPRQAHEVFFFSGELSTRACGNIQPDIQIKFRPLFLFFEVNFKKLNFKEVNYFMNFGNIIKNKFENIFQYFVMS